MASEDWQSGLPIRARDHEELTKRLVLLGSLTDFFGQRVRRETTGDTIRDARRDFLDGFAYLCDIEKGGGTVTAAMLQETRAGNILWLAANDGVQSKIREHADIVLRLLRRLIIDSEDREVLREAIYSYAIEFSQSRINTYMKLIKMTEKQCRKSAEKIWGEGVFEEKGSHGDVQRTLQRVAELLHLKRRQFIDAFHAMAMDGLDHLRQEDLGGRNSCFAQLAHYIGRISATPRAVDKVVRGMLRVPSLKDIVKIDYVTATRTQKIRWAPSPEPNPYEIVRCIGMESSLRNPAEARAARVAIAELDDPLTDDGLRRRMVTSGPDCLKVHAELQVADMASRREMVFADGDKYIGCSKAACYFCYRWLGHHPFGFELPATHQKIITKCRGPDENLDEDGARRLRLMYSRVSASVGQDILSLLLDYHSEARKARLPHWMSSDATSVVPSRLAS